MLGAQRTFGLWLGLAVVLCAAWAAEAADWPQFLGPNRDGVVPDAKGLARTWPAHGPKVLWSTPLGVGFGGPAIYGDSVLLLDREEDARDVLRRFSLSNGRELWRLEYQAPGKLQYNGSRSSPATDGDLVFTVGPFGHIHAVKFSDGSVVWKADLLKDWRAARPKWGVSNSPLLWGDLVIVTPWGRKAAVVAYRKKTGEVAWTTPNPAGIVQEYQSAVPMTLVGRAMIVATGRRGYAIGVDLETGRRLWTYTGYPQNGWNIPSPISAGDDQVLITGGYNCGSAMFKVERKDRGYVTREVWKNRNMGTKTAQALVHGGYLYSNSTDVGGGLRCLALDDGTIKWDSRDNRRRFEQGNLIIADGLIFIVAGKGGRLFMVEATPEGYRELASAKLLSGSMVWAPMAYKDGKLVLRDQKKLVCVDLRAGGR